MSGFRKVGICPFNPSAISVIELPPGHDSFLRTSYLTSVSEPTPSLSGPNQDNSENEGEAELYVTCFGKNCLKALKQLQR